MIRTTPLRLYPIPVSAPFAMPPISIADFSQVRQFDIRQFGANANQQQANDQAIAKAIDAAHAEGGGRVVIPPGVWPCSTIHLKSFVDLHVSEHATLLFSGQPQDYLPAVKTTWEGMECYNYSPLIYAYECEAIAVSGKGKLTVNMDIWTEWGKRPKPHMDALARLYHMAAQGLPVEERQMAYEGANLRPHFIQFNRCQHVLLEEVTIEHSPFWVIHPFLCRDVVVRRVKVSAHGHNNDGVDPEMTQNMLIEECVFDQGDDAISVKSGRNQDAWRLDVPTRNIVMRNCRIVRGHQLLAVGSELSAGIENVLIENCDFDDGQTLQSKGFGNVMFVKTNERRGGYVRNIIMRNIRASNIAGGALCVATDVLYQWKDLVPTYEVRLTRIEGLHLENVHIGNAQFLSKIDAQADAPVKLVTLKNVTAEQLSEQPVQHVNVSEVSLELS